MTDLDDMDFDADNYTPAMNSRVLAEPARTMTPCNPADPARLGYPPTFPIEIALRTSPVDEICEGYGISPEEWALIQNDPTFLADLKRAMDMLREEGMSFKVKAKLQAEELLKTAWREIHNVATPPNVRADLIKATVRWAGYETTSAQGNGNAPGSGFTIAINFTGDKPEPKVINP